MYIVQTSLLPVFFFKDMMLLTKNTAESPSGSGMGAVISCANLTVFLGSHLGVVSGEN